MDILSIILIGVGLAMDCFAVSTTQGLRQKRWHPKALLMAVLFGFFQGGMPLIGYMTGLLFADFFNRFAPWIALVLLAFLGGKMIVESMKEKEEADADFSIKTLLLLAIATSIDALATGVVFIPCPEWLWSGVSMIAVISFVFSLAGYLIGVFVGGKFRLNVELIGGLILIAIGIKIFVEGICF